MSTRLPALSRARTRLAAFGRAYGRDREGATAVEFAMVALPLIFLLFSLLELAMVFMIQTTLENATYNAARTIRTGAMQSSGTGNADAMKASICKGMTWLGASCSTNLEVDVRTYADFPDPSATDKTNPRYIKPLLTSDNKFDTAWQPGNAGDIVLVRAAYKWKLVTPFLNGGLMKGNGTSLITASSVFRVEPFS